MRIAPLVPLAVLAGGVFVALATQRLVEASAGGESMPRLDMREMRVHSFEQRRRTSFRASEAIFEGDSIAARTVSGRMQVGAATFDFDALRMQVQGGGMLLEEEVELRGQHSTLKAQRVQIGGDGSMEGTPAMVSDTRQGATFLADSFAIDREGDLRLQGRVKAVFEQ